MKMRTVGLLGLVLVHISASALPNKCLNNYQKASENLTKDLDKLSSRESMIAGVGYGSAAAGVGSCAFKAKTIAGKVVCSLLFLAVGYVTYETQSSLSLEREKMIQLATIYEVYRDFKAPGAMTELEKDALAQIGVSSAYDAEVTSLFVQLMESGEFCNKRGRPDKTLDEVVRAVQLKILD